MYKMPKRLTYEKKPEKMVYPNQKRMYKRIREFVESKLVPEIFEAYLTGSIVNGKFGSYIKRYKEHGGSDIDVVVMIPKKSIPKTWKDLKTEGTWWDLYSGGEIEIGDISHRLDLLVVKEGKEEFARKRLKDLGWKLEDLR